MKSQRSESSSHSRKKSKSKKQSEPPADSKEVFILINKLRESVNLPEIKSQKGIEDYAAMLITDASQANLESDAYVTLSNMSFFEEFDGKMSAAALIRKWMRESNRRPVLLAPGKQGSVVFLEYDDVTYISVVVVSFFH